MTEGEADFDPAIELAQRAREEIRVSPLKYTAIFSAATLIGYKLMLIRRVPGLSGTLMHRMNVLVSMCNLRMIG